MNGLQWTEPCNDDATEWCGQPLCDTEAVGYVIASGGARHCLCAACRDAFYLGASMALSEPAPDLEFFSLHEEEEWYE